MSRNAGFRRSGAPSARLLMLPALFFLGYTLVDCSSRDKGAANLPPHVKILGSPLDGDSVNYVVDFHWLGRDDDGSVERYEYAVDIPSTFTAEQIADPATVGIDWVNTTSSTARLHFRVGAFDSTAVATGLYATTSPAAPHSFFVRAFDNDGAHSAVVVRSFNAWTLLPETTIRAPQASEVGYLRVGRCVTVHWTGFDPDGPSPDHRPVATEYRLIRGGVLSRPDLNQFVNGQPGSSYPWVRVAGDSGSVTVSLETPQGYFLAFRSIDEAGGIESRFDYGRNVLVLSTTSSNVAGHPYLTVHEPVLGDRIFPVDGDVVNFEVIAGQCLNFEMTADAQSYGGTIEAYRWCVDAENSPLEEGTLVSCVPWGTAPVLPPICFTTPGIHTVAFAARSVATECDDGAAATSGLYSFNVLPLTSVFQRDVLYVDDYFDPAGDAESDRRFLAALHDAGFVTVDSYSAWDAGDLDGAVTPPTLGLLSRYKLVFWSVRGTGGGSQNAMTALLESNACLVNRTLQAYVASGGGVWINGDYVFSALKSRNVASGVSCLASLNSNDVGLNFGAGEFVTDFLHVNGGDFRNAKTSPTTHGLLRARPTAAALAEGFPPLEADSTTFAYTVLGGLPFYDAQFGPAFRAEGGLDTLYTAETVRPQSPFNVKPIAWRYADPAAVPRQGPVAVTSFPLQKMKEGVVSHVVDGVRVPGTGLKGLVEVLGAWFRAHDATGTGS